MEPMDFAEEKELERMARLGQMEVFCADLGSATLESEEEEGE